MPVISEAYRDATTEQLVASQHRLGLYEDLVRHATLGMAIYEWTEPPDPGSFRLVAANPWASRATGLDLSTQVDRPIREVRSELIARHEVEHWVEVLEHGSVRAWEREVEDAVYEVRCIRARERHIVEIFEDVTPRRRLEREVHVRLSELERSNRDLDDFAYVASHDLKAPLRDIQNLARWLVEDLQGSLPPASTRHIEQLQARVGRMENLLDDLLSYSRAGRDRTAPESFLLRDAVSSAVDLAGVHPGYLVVLDIPFMVMNAPRAPFEQVVRNLLSNASTHHDRAGGSIRVVAAAGTEGRVHVRVDDDGPGIPVAFRERAFRMFQTLRPRDAVEGSGMGLAIVKRLVESYGGTVSLHDAEPRGLSVRFTWPVHCAGLPEGTP